MKAPARANSIGSRRRTESDGCGPALSARASTRSESKKAATRSIGSSIRSWIDSPGTVARWASVHSTPAGMKRG